MHRTAPVLLSILVGFIGVLACGVGIFVTEPIGYLAVASLYRFAENQRLA